MNKSEAAILRNSKMTPEQRHNRAQKAGIARAKKLTPEQRKAISAKAIKTRWDNYRVIHRKDLK